MDLEEYISEVARDIFIKSNMGYSSRRERDFKYNMTILAILVVIGIITALILQELIK